MIYINIYIRLGHIGIENKRIKKYLNIFKDFI